LLRLATGMADRIHGVRPAKQVPFYIMRIVRTKGEAEGEPDLFVRIIPGIMYLGDGLPKFTVVAPISVA
jgi:hypothetical protein